MTSTQSEWLIISRNVAMKHIKVAIAAAREIADRLENACPASQADTPNEDVAHELIHALLDAAGIAERAIQR